MLCRVNAAVLSASAAKAEHQVCKSPFHVALDMGISQFVYSVEKGQYFSVVFKKFDYRFVESGKFFVGLVAAGVMGASAIEHVATAIA